ncbi:hypothetical protein SAY86_020011 [Trapa natans]|uniref:C2 domain-containing protein n=1 Tax=Trapa natans TaxID=22666 RepID=A0AAN7LYN1_TRANT|nr:hypothetical protein SAY86_020011 [Trapa natans]
MGKASRWFRSLLGMKKSGSSSPTSTAPQKRRWSFVKSRKDRDGQSHPVALGEIDADCDDPEKHAIAVAAATAAVAEAALSIFRACPSSYCSAIKHKINGVVSIYSIRFYLMRGEPVSAVPLVEPTRKASFPRTNSTTLNRPKFSHPFYPRPAMVQGKLEVLLISARGLEDMDFLNKMDPYVILSYRTQDKRSSIASGQGSEPSWNESFLFTVSGNLSEMKLKILDSDTGTSDDFVGEAIIPLGPVFEEGSIPPTSYKVVKGEAYSGEIRLSLTFTPEVRHDRGLPEEESFGGWKQSSFD